MNTILCFTLRFLDPVPQFHGRGDDGDPEWPPSPLRFFQALVSAAANRFLDCSNQDSVRHALSWLETLQPSVMTPQAAFRSFGYRMYVPNNSGDLMTAAWARGDTETSMAKFRVEKDVRPLKLAREAVHYLYPLPDDLTEAHRHFATLRSAARSITHLGWGIDMVAGNAEILDDAEVNALAQGPVERWEPAVDGSGTGLRVPVAGTLDALIARHTAFLGRLSDDGFRPVPPLTKFKVVSYRRPTDYITRPNEVFQLVLPEGGLFAYPQDKLIHIAGMVRHLAIEAMQRSQPPGVPADWVESYVAGHAKPGDTEHRQFSFVPLPSIGHAHTDPAIRRVMICAPIGDRAWLKFLTARLLGCQLKPTPETKLKTSAPLLVRPDSQTVTERYTARAHTWASVTPVILPGHNDHSPAKTRKLIDKALAQAGIDVPCEYEWRAVSWFPKSLTAHKYNKQGRMSGYLRPDHMLSQTAVHMRICFADGYQYSGPLAIGAGRHCGFGLFARHE